MTEYEFHPLADTFPLMSESALAGLAADIKARGQQHPIILFEGKILDGRDRYRACKLAGVEPKFIEYTGDDQDLSGWIRRHMRKCFWQRWHNRKGRRTCSRCYLAQSST